MPERTCERRRTSLPWHLPLEKLLGYSCLDVWRVFRQVDERFLELTHRDQGLRHNWLSILKSRFMRNFKKRTRGRAASARLPGHVRPPVSDGSQSQKVGCQEAELWPLDQQILTSWRVADL